ncbi:hypothetical protein LZK77_16315 [Rhizobium leguminosarum]|nr:hypothetical protein LZK77_16315 [Rhizobium leguminosarum]
MIPVSSLADVEIRWLKIKERGYAIHGFLVYSSSDHRIPEYIADEGLTDLDLWTGDSCGMFLLHEPPPDWVEYARRTNHVWWRAYGTDVSGYANGALENEPFIRVDGGRRVSPRDLVSNNQNMGLAKQQVAQVLYHFGLQPTDHPCMVMFRDLYDTNVWIIPLEELVGKEILILRKELQEFFSSGEFERLLEAENA